MAKIIKFEKHSKQLDDDKIKAGVINRMLGINYENYKEMPDEIKEILLFYKMCEDEKIFDLLDLDNPEDYDPNNILKGKKAESKMKKIIYVINCFIEENILDLKVKQKYMQEKINKLKKSGK